MIKSIGLITLIFLIASASYCMEPAEWQKALDVSFELIFRFPF